MTPPDRLYRYRPLAGDLAVRELEAFRNAYLWSPHLTEMNDSMEVILRILARGKEWTVRLWHRPPLS